MQQYQERVIVEKQELGKKIESLTNFLAPGGTTQVSAEEQDRLQRQLDVMVAYSGILDERIEAFGEPIAETETSEKGEDEDPSNEEE